MSKEGFSLILKKQYQILVLRQKVQKVKKKEWQKNISESVARSFDFSCSDQKAIFNDALLGMQKRQGFWGETKNGQLHALVKDYVTDLKKWIYKEQAIIAQSNKDRIMINNAIRNSLLEENIIDTSEVLKIERTLKGREFCNETIYHGDGGKEKIKEIFGEELDRHIPDIELAKGDIVVTKENDPEKNIVKGSRMQIEKVEGSLIHVKTLEGGLKKTIDTNEYKDIDYGYAGTLMSSQGASIDKVYVFFSWGHWDFNSLYVALTRHKSDLKMYFSMLTWRESEFNDFEEMVQRLPEIDESHAPTYNMEKKKMKSRSQ